MEIAQGGTGACEREGRLVRSRRATHSKNGSVAGRKEEEENKISGFRGVEVFVRVAGPEGGPTKWKNNSA